MELHKAPGEIKILIEKMSPRPLWLCANSSSLQQGPQKHLKRFLNQY